MRLLACLSTCLFAASASTAGPKPTSEAIEFFESKVRPVLAEHCYSCHGEKKQSSGLRLDTKAGLMKGTDEAPVVVPGEPEKSALVKAVKHAGEIKMPPKSKLPDAAVEALTAWVKLGVPYPEDANAAAGDASQTHWAFQPSKDTNPPATKSPVDHPIDRFIQARLEEKGWALSPAADKRTLIRR